MKVNFVIFFLFPMLVISSNCSAKIVDEKTKIQIEKINTTLPKMVDADTRLDKVKATDTGFIYVYSLINLLAENLEKNAIRDVLYPVVYEQVCTNKGTRRNLKRGFRIGYLYLDKKGKEIGGFTFTEKDWASFIFP